jgi:hypothetical protein
MLLSIAMTDLALEWFTRHWAPRTLGSAVRGVDPVITPRSRYIRESLREEGSTPIPRSAEDKIIELIEAISREQAEQLLKFSA